MNAPVNLIITPMTSKLPMSWRLMVCSCSEPVQNANGAHYHPKPAHEHCGRMTPYCLCGARSRDPRHGPTQNTRDAYTQKRIVMAYDEFGGSVFALKSRRAIYS